MAWKIPSRIWDYIKAAAVVAPLSALAGAIGSNYLDFISEQRKSLEADANKMKETSTSFVAVLDAYSSKAVTGAPVDPAVSKNLQDSVLRLSKNAEAIQEHIPAIKPDVESYEGALIELQEAADKFNGPLDGRQFVQATSKYLHEQQKLDSKVSAAQKSFWRSFL